MVEQTPTASEATAAPQSSGKASSALTERQELLLVAFHDGACGVVEAMQARLLLKCSKAAREFIESVRRTDSAFCDYSESIEQDCKVDLWDRISARIEAERRAEVFLGERTYSTRARSSSLWNGVAEWRARLAWSAGGAAFASVVAMSLVTTGYIGGAGAGAITTIAQPRSQMVIPSAAQVAFSPERVGRAEPIEMDWMRSEGRVQVLRDPSERTAIIWVKPRTQPQVNRATEVAQRMSRLSRSNSRIPVAIPATGR